MSPSRASHKARLDNLQKQISIYSKERAHLQSKIQTLSLDNEINLEENIKKQEEKLALLVKENLKLNKFGNFNLPPITKTMESEEDLLREIKIFQKSISGLEETIKNQSEKLKNESEKSLELEKKFDELKKNAGDVKTENISSVYNGLKKKLQVLMNSWKSNVQKMENIIKENENSLKVMNEKVTQIKTKLFKQEQQKRLLEMSHDDYNNMKKQGLFISNTPDTYHPDVSFLFRPSVKALYST